MIFKPKRMALWLILLAIICSLLFVGCKTWKATGRAPRGERLKKMEQLPYFQNGQFQNLEPTIMLSNKDGLLKNLWKFLVTKYPDGKPKQPIPSIKQTSRRSISIAISMYGWGIQAFCFNWMGSASY